MLNLLRKNAGAWLIKVILGAIVVVFVFWGVGSFRSQRAGRVALVNGQPITVEDYREAYNNLIEQFRQRFGNSFNDDMIKMFNLRQQALDQLINQKLLLGEAQALEFRVSDADVAEAIAQMGVFRNGDAFDVRRYQAILGRYRMTPEAFEAMQKDAMLVEKLRSLVLGSVKVSDIEARQWYTWQNAQVDIDYLLIEPSRYTDIPTGEADLKAYFEANQAAYKTEPKVKVRYVRFDPRSFEDKIKISDAEIENHYQNNPAEFKKAETVEARHVLIKVDTDAGSDADQAAKQKALKVMDLARSGKDFADLAKEYSEGPTREQGGYLGTFARDAMVKPFSDAAFAMKAGEISEPVRTQFGWHVIKVEKLNPAHTLSLDEARAQITATLKTERARNLAYDQALEVYGGVGSDIDLEKAAAARNVPVRETDFFDRKGPSAGDITNPARFAEVAFGLDGKEISDIQDLGDGYYILQPVERIPETIPDFKAVEETVKANWLKEKQAEQAQKDAEALLAALKNGRSFSEESQARGLQPASTGFFKRTEAIPNIGYERGIAEEAFRLSAEKPFPEIPLKGAKGYYVLKFKDRKNPTAEGFAAERKQIEEMLLQQKQARFFREWMAQLRNRSEVTIEEGFLNT